jgi:hypothetical protein
MRPSTNGRLFSGASNPRTKTFSHSGQVAHSARATAWRISSGMTVPSRRSLRASRSIARDAVNISAGKKLAGENSLARVRVSRWRVNSLNLVQLWIQRKTREELPPALIRDYFPTGPPNFCWKKSPLFQVGRCCALATRSPIRKSSFASRVFDSQSNGRPISSCGV